MPVMGISKFERFFREAASLDIDEDDLDRYRDFINRKVYDLLLRGEATATANGRDIIEPYDLPITLGIRECMRDFEDIDKQIEIKPILEELTARPPLDLDYSADTEAQIPDIAGGLTVALARIFKIVDTDLKNPQTEHWERANRIFDLLL